MHLTQTEPRADSDARISEFAMPPNNDQAVFLICRGQCVMRVVAIARRDQTPGSGGLRSLGSMALPGRRRRQLAVSLLAGLAVSSGSFGQVEEWAASGPSRRWRQTASGATRPLV
jgi:hypothetical protein